MLIFFCFVLLLFPASFDAQQRGEGVQENVDLTIVERIRDEGLKRSPLQENAQYLTDVIGPRLAGSPAMKQANEWAARKMREYGFENVGLEPFEFGRGWEETSYFGRMVQPFVKPLHGRSMAWSGSTNGLRSGPAVIVTAESAGELERYQGNIRGAWILLDKADENRRFYTERLPERWPLEELLTPGGEERPRTAAERAQEVKTFRRRFELLNKLKEYGALGILHRSIFPDGTIGWGEAILGEEIPPAVLRRGGPIVLPSLILADPDYALIYRNVLRRVPVILQFDIQNRFLEDDATAYNTLGDIPGTNKQDEFVILGAHLDSWHMGTGAADNGAGSLIVLEAGRILKAIGVEPRRTIRFALWGGHEPERLDHTGLFGSTSYVEAHRAELDKISVYFNLDNGTGRIRGIWSQNHPQAIPIFEQLLLPLRDLGAVVVRPGVDWGSDFVPFENVGVPSFKTIQDPIAWGNTFHTDADTYEALRVEDLKQAAIVMASIAYHLAMRDEMFPRKPSAKMSSPDAGAAPGVTGQGHWGPVLKLPTHPEQMAVLPSGKVLMWPWAPERYTPPHGPLALWDPSDGNFTTYPGSGVESASGLAFQPDGTLLIAGGDRPVGGVDGNPRCFTFDYVTEQLTEVESMAAGRVFPGATTLGTGDIFITGGLDEKKQINGVPELWDGSTWTQLPKAFNNESRGPTFQFLAPDGRLFRAGPERLTDWLDMATGTWSDVEPKDRNQARYHGTAVMYDDGKILLAGGCSVGPENGWNQQCSGTPLRTAEVIDLRDPSPAWRQISRMAFPRHSHHATLLPDGSVLITGGTDQPGIFNDEAEGILTAELWDPATGAFRKLAPMAEPRHFQSTAVLLPDARVLVAGGAFGQGPAEAHFSWSGQIYSPPYLERGPRPTISGAPSSVRYGAEFTIHTPTAEISGVVLVGLSTSLGGRNLSQRLARLTFRTRPGALQVEAPLDPNRVPPGFYLLFILNDRGVPSVGHALRIGGE